MTDVASVVVICASVVVIFVSGAVFFAVSWMVQIKLMPNKTAKVAFFAGISTIGTFILRQLPYIYKVLSEFFEKIIFRFF